MSSKVNTKSAKSTKKVAHLMNRVAARKGHMGRFCCRKCGGIGAVIAKVVKEDKRIIHLATCKCGCAVRRVIPTA